MRKVLFLKGLLTIIMLAGLVFPATPVMADGPDTTDPVPSEQAPADAPAEQAPVDAPAEQAPADAPAEQAPADAPAEQAPAEVSPADVPAEAPVEAAPADVPVEAAPVEVPLAEVVADAAAADVTLANAEGKPLIAAAEDTVELLEEGDPYFTDPVSGITYGWTFWSLFHSHGCAAGVTVCNKVINPIQAAITAAPAGATIYIENPPGGHNYTQDVSIDKRITLERSGVGSLTIGGTVTLKSGADVTNNNIFANNVFVNGGSIQDGIDLVTTGGTVTIASGSFIETVTISRDVDLKSSGSGATTTMFILNDGAKGSSDKVYAPDVEINNGASLQLGIDLAQTDGTVTVNPGVYTESVKIERSLNLIAPEGATIDKSGSDNAVITLDSPEGFFDRSCGDQTNVFIQGFDLLGGTYGIKISENFYGSLTVQDTTIIGALATQDALHSERPVDTAGIELQGGDWDLLKWLLTGDGWRAADLTSLTLDNVDISNFDNGIDMNNEHVNVDQLNLFGSSFHDNLGNGVNLAEGTVSGMDVSVSNFFNNDGNGLYIGNDVLSDLTDIRSLGDGEPTQPESAFTLFGNQFTFNGLNGVLIDQGTGVTNGGAEPIEPITVVMTLNRFFGNGLNGVSLGGGEPENQGFWWHGDDNVKPPVAVSAADNWWGCNAGPNTPLCDSTSGQVSLKNEFGTDAWLIYMMLADPQTINIGGDTATITGPFMTGYGDLTYGEVTPPWFTPGDVSMDAPQLGTLAQTLTLALNNWKFTSGDTAGVQWFSAPPLDNESPKVSVEIVDPCVVNPTGPGCGSDQGDGNDGGTFGVFREQGTGGDVGVGGILTGAPIPVTGSGLMNMLCGSASVFELEDGTLVTFAPDLCGYMANLALPGEDELPPLPEGDSFVGSVSANLIKDGTALDTVPSNTTMAVSFPNPPEGAAILFWDTTSNTWVEVAATLNPDTGYLEATVPAPGLYVMVTR